MYNLSDAIQKSGKTTRYSDPDTIAQKYEAYMKGIQYYIISQIEAGKIAKKKVAVIETSGKADTDNDGTVDAFQLVDNTVSIGTSTDRPAESIMYISDNLYSDDSVKKISYEVETTNREQTVKSTVVGASAKDIAANADVIIQAGHGTMTEAQIREAFTAAGADLGDKPVYATDPSDVFTIRANSVENFAGVGIFGGYLYPEIVNPIYATMYIYENFWHLNNADLVNFANANFANASLPAGITRSGAGYKSADIQKMIEEGLAYGQSHAATYKDTTLALTDRLDLSTIQKDTNTVNKSAQTITVKATNKTYKAKALKKKAQTYKAIAVSGNQGTVTYKVTKSNKNIKFSKGKVTVKKGTKKGTYTIKVKVAAKATDYYKAAPAVTKTIKVKVK